MGRASRRARRRAKARLRDLLQHGTAELPDVPALAPVTGGTFRAFREAMPESTGQVRQKASVPRKQVQELQRIESGRPKGKRTVRYTARTQWHGLRTGEGNPGARRVRMLPPEYDK